MTRKHHLSLSIVLLCFMVFIMPNTAYCGLFSRPWSDLEVDYLADVVSPDLTYFDGNWGGSMSCRRIKSYPGFTGFRDFNIERGAGVLERGIKASRGYKHWKIKIKKTGKVTVRGTYYHDKYASIDFWGRIGVDPEDPMIEVMSLTGTRGSRTCTSKLTRLLPQSAMKVLAAKIPKLAESLVMQNKATGGVTPPEVEEQKVKLLAIKKAPRDVTPPQIVIFSHDTSRAIKIVRDQKKIKIQGQATDKNGIVEVIVNNKEARLDEKGNFDVDIYLGIG